MNSRETLEAFDRYLAERGLRLDAPTADELRAILPWLTQQDGNPDWPGHARATVADLGKRLGHGV